MSYAAPVPASSPGDSERVSACNAAFYDAFETGDMRAMASAWEHSDRVSCTHPGTPILRGWPAVEQSWRLLLGSPSGRPQFILTEEAVEVVGDVAWVTLVENMIIGDRSAATTAVNWFVRNDDDWQLVGHHGAPIERPPIG